MATTNEGLRPYAAPPTFSERWANETGSGSSYHRIILHVDIGLYVANCNAQAISKTEVTVSTNLDVLEAQVLQLTPADRAHLFERLIASLDTDSAVEQAWEWEADRREADLDSGVVAAVPGPQAIARLRAKLSQ